MEESGGKPDFRFLHLSRTGLHRSKEKGSSPASPIDQFTLAMTDDGAPIESNFVEILDLRELFISQDSKGHVFMHPKGACSMKLGAAQVPFLAACWQATLGDPWACPSEADEVIHHYWVWLVQGLGAGGRISSTEADTGMTTYPSNDQVESTQDEIARLREALAIAQAQANHWRNVAETL